jgi:uncharacterized protein
MAKCPNCESDMETVTIDAIELDECPNCKGIWFDADELNKVLELDKAEVAQVDSTIDLEKDKEVSFDRPPAFCPRCSGALEPRRYDTELPAIMEVCPRGHGIWLDNGELLEIHKYYERAFKIKPGSAKPLDEKEFRKKMIDNGLGGRLPAYVMGRFGPRPL